MTPEPAPLDGPLDADASEWRPDAARAARLADPELRALLRGYLRPRVPEADVEDVVQTVLLAALGAPRSPSDPEELRRWLIGVARHKVADLHRERARLRGGEVPTQAAEAVDEASEWLLWAEKQIEGDRDGARTLGWLARESEGEKLSQIAASETVPAPQLRQKVSRLRRLLKRRWHAEAAVLSLLLIAGLVSWRLLRPPEPQALPRLEPSLVVPTLTKERRDRITALDLRVQAVWACDRGLWEGCLHYLDASVLLAPETADDPLVQLTRARAEQAKEWQRVDEELERTPLPNYKTGP